MYQGKSFLAVIPARGGSKRLPRKNTLELNGLPVISYTISAAKQSTYIDCILVTSEDAEILSISQDAGVEIIRRPAELASDTTTTIDVIEHAIKNSEHFDYIVLLQPTSPLRTAEHIDEAIKLLDAKKADAIASVCEVDHNPLWANTLDSSLSMSGFINESIHNKRSQDLETHYRLNGAIYICSTDRLLSEKRFLISNDIYAYTMSKETSIDIDERIDLLRCEYLLQELTIK